MMAEACCVVLASISMTIKELFADPVSTITIAVEYFAKAQGRTMTETGFFAITMSRSMIAKELCARRDGQLSATGCVRHVEGG